MTSVISVLSSQPIISSHNEHISIAPPPPPEESILGGGAVAYQNISFCPPPIILTT